MEEPGNCVEGEIYGDNSEHEQLLKQCKLQSLYSYANSTLCIPIQTPLFVFLCKLHSLYSYANLFVFICFLIFVGQFLFPFFVVFFIIFVVLFFFVFCWFIFFRGFVERFS